MSTGFILLIVSFFIHQVTISHAYTINGAEIRDLEYQGTYFDNELASWGYTWFSCGARFTCGGSALLGGTGCWDGNYGGSSSYITRTYSSLPPHEIVYLQFTLWRVDSWDWNDYVSIYLGGTGYWLRDMNGAPSDLCGNGNGGDSYVYILMKYIDSSSSLTFTLYNQVDENRFNEAPGIRDISLVLRNMSAGYTESNMLIAQGGSQYPGSGSWSGNNGCNIWQYWDGSTCVNCDGSCFSCYDGSNRDCYRCNDGYFYTSSMCRACAGTCRTCSDVDSKSCTSCYGSNYLYPDGSCRSTCSVSGMAATGGPPYRCDCSANYFQTDTTCNTCPAPFQVVGPTCIGPCSSGYYYVNGSCLTTCSHTGFSLVTNRGVQFCNFACASTDFYYADGTCSSTCNYPFKQYTLSAGYKYCLFPCSTSQYFYINYTCSTSCPSPFTGTTVSIYKYCDFPCLQSEYRYIDGSCQTTCPSPFVVTNITVSAFCLFPCSMSTFRYANGSCLSTCTAPFTQVNLAYAKYCNFPCNQNQFLFANGSCLSSCPSPLRTINIGSGVFCNFPCLLTEYYYSNGTCASSCPTYGFTAVNITIGGYCYFNCARNQYYYLNNTCSSACLSPYRAANVSVGGFCFFPCSQGQYYYVNGSCLSTCPTWPYTAVNVSVGGLCNFACPRNQYIYLNGTCRSTCQAPFAAFNVSVGGICNFPCLQNEYLYFNGTCSTVCAAPFTAINISVGGYCNFKCAQNLYLYANGSCLATCSSPFISLNISVGAYCNFPCPQNQYYYSNGSCLNTCPGQPYMAKNVSVGGICSFYCLTGVYYYQNKTCQSTCPSPLQSVSVSVGLLCNFPCASNSLYYYVNGSCLSGCQSPGFTATNISVGGICNITCPINLYQYDNSSCLSTCSYPFISQNSGVGLLCKFPCLNYQYWYTNGSCLNKCPQFPFIATNISVGGLCRFYCNSNMYYFSNITCLPTCPSPLKASNVSVGGLCSFPCPSGKYYFQNGTCGSTCPSYGFFQLNISIGLFCNFLCTQSQFYYSNGSCLSTCPSPFLSTNISVGGLCNFPCSNSNLYYYPTTDICSTTCSNSNPYSMLDVRVGNFCYFACSVDLYYYSDGTCNPTCDSPLIPTNMSYGATCEFPCPSGQFYSLYSSRCMSNCSLPDTQTNISIGIYCNEYIEPAGTATNDSVQATVYTTVAVTAPALILGSNPYTAMATVSLLQTVNFVLYYNVNYPNILKDLLKTTGNIGFMRFVPNPFAWFTTLPKVESPPNFANGGYSGLWVENEGKLVFVGLLLGVLYASGFLMSGLMGVSAGVGAKGAALSTFSRGMVIRTCLVFYSDVVTACWLQIMNFDTSTNIGAVSGFLAVASLAGTMAVPALIIKTLSMDGRVLNKNVNKYESLTEDYDMTKDLAKYYTAVITIRKFLHSSAIVLFYNKPIIQIAVPWMLNTGMIGIICFVQPHHNMMLNLYDLGNELGLFMMHSSIMILGLADRTSEDTEFMRDFAGYFIYSTIWCTITAGMVHVWAENVKTGIAVYKSFKMKKALGKVLPDMGSHVVKGNPLKNNYNLNKPMNAIKTAKVGPTPLFKSIAVS